MKRIFALLLCLLMTASVFAGCEKDGGSGSDKEPQQPVTGVFEAGYGRVDVTPDEKNSMSLAGHGYERLSTAVLDQLYVTCVALKDEYGTTYLLYHCDFLKVYNALNMSKKQISNATGVPIENIMIATTHNHSAPGLDDANSAIIEDYAKMVKKAMVTAGETAVADLKPAKMYTSEIVCNDLNVIRSIGVSSNFSEELDKTMELIKLEREDAKDIVLMNWQGHPRGHSGNMNAVLSDVDQIRKNIEPALDCYFAFFLGASGNVNNSNKKYDTYTEHYKVLTNLAVEAAANFKEITDGAIKKASTKVQLTYRTGGGSDDVTISVISIGKSMAFVIVPYEMFSISAKDLKAYSQFDQTFIVTCADNHFGYLPSDATASDAYEMRVTNYIVGSAELLVEGYTTLLDQLYAQ